LSLKQNENGIICRGKHCVLLGLGCVRPSLVFFRFDHASAFFLGFLLGSELLVVRSSSGQQPVLDSRWNDPPFFVCPSLFVARMDPRLPESAHLFFRTIYLFDQRFGGRLVCFPTMMC